MFKLIFDFLPTEEQKQAVDKLCSGVNQGFKNQVLLGVTGSGKTFTMANIIQKLQMPALIISHNKTLAGQLYQEMRTFFPQNAVSYFISYYDYYQPEAYIPQTDTYIEKEAEINQLIDKLRLKTTTNILTRNDVIAVASVSCIYNIGSPREFGRFTLELSLDQIIDRKEVFLRLTELQYERNDFDFKRGAFRVRGENIDIYPAYEEFAFRLLLKNEKITKIITFNPLSGQEIKSVNILENIVIYPAKHYLTDKKTFENVEKKIRSDLEIEYSALKKQNKKFEAERLIKKVNYDLEMIAELGYVNGIENYSRYFDGRKIGQPPYTLLNYFNERFAKNWLVFIDESHMTVPQIRGMFNGDYSRKKTLVDFGFRLKAAFDNRPLKFAEFYQQSPKFIHLSATPDEWEINKSKVLLAQARESLKFKAQFTGIAEQLVRPTGIVDPKITIKPADGEIADLIKEIEKRAAKNERVLVTTLTKRIAEDLTDYLKEKKIKAEYLHADIKTLERGEILNNLRKQNFDVLIGINLLREGLDLPEVSLVAILDADREGFLRSKTALIQTMGRAARNISGEVIIYADSITKSIREAVAEVERRRKYQIEYNEKHKIIPTTIKKSIRENIVDNIAKTHCNASLQYIDSINLESQTPYDKKKLIDNLKKEMKRQAKELNFELAIAIREKIKEIQGNF